MIAGAGLSKADYEERAMRIDPLHREGEADLVASRWFDYSTLHPAAATYLYAHHYKKQTRIFCETCIDIRTAAEARAFTPDDIFSSRDMTSMWLARRCADGLGAPYEFVMRFVQERALARLFHVFPRPNQLYSEEFEIDLKAAWLDHQSRVLTYSRLPVFKMSQFSGTAIQRKHQAYLAGQIKARPVHYKLLGRVFHEGLMDETAAAQHFPVETIDKAHKIAASLAG